MFTIQKNAAKASNTGKLRSSLPKIIKGTSPNQKPPVVSPALLFEKEIAYITKKSEKQKKT